MAWPASSPSQPKFRAKIRELEFLLVPLPKSSVRIFAVALFRDPFSL